MLIVVIGPLASPRAKFGLLSSQIIVTLNALHKTPGGIAQLVSSSRLIICRSWVQVPVPPLLSHRYYEDRVRTNTIRSV